MSFKGDLHSVPLGDVLQTLFQNEKQGRLELDCPDFKKAIYCCPAGITLLEPEVLKRRRFGEIVVTAGLANRTQIEECLKDAASDKSIGKVLLENNIIDDETINRIMRIQVEEELFCLFDLSRGKFEFFENEDERARIEKNSLPMFQVEGVVFEAARRMDEWSYIRTYIPDLDSIFIMVNGAEITGADNEVKILEQMDGRQSVRDISDSLLASPFDVAKVMATLVEQKKIRISEKLELLTLAQDMIDEGEITRAGVILKKLRPNLKNIILGEYDVQSLADLFYKVGDILTATNILLTKVRQDQKSESAGDYLPFLEQAHRIAPQDTRILNELAKLAENLGDNTARVQYLTALAKIHIKESKHELSIKVCEQIMEVDPGNAFVIENMPNCLVNANNKENAVDFLENMVDQLGKKADPQLVAGIYRKIIKIDPARKGISEKLNKAMRKVKNKNKKFIHLAGMVVILTGGVVSWFVNTGENMTDMDRVAYASMKFAQNDIEGARSALLSAMETLEEPDAVDQANLLLANIDKRLNQGEQMTVEVEKKKYFDRLQESQASTEVGRYDKSIVSLLSLSADFDTIQFGKTTREEAEIVMAKIRSEIPLFRNRLTEFSEPGVEEELQEVYDEYHDLATPEKVESLTALSQALKSHAEEDLFKDLIDDEVIAGVEALAAQTVDLRGKLDKIENRLNRLNTLSDLSTLYNEAEKAEEEGRLDKAYELYTELTNQYGQGTLSDDFNTKQAELHSFFTTIDQVRSHVESDRFDEAYDMAIDLLQRYEDEAHWAFVEVPVHVTAVPADVRIHSQGQDMGTAPTLVRLHGKQTLNLSLEREGYERATFAIDWSGGAKRQLTLNRESLFSIKVGGIVEAQPMLEGDNLIVPSRGGDIFRIDALTGDILKKHDTKSLSGVATPVVSAHDNLYFTTVEGELWMMEPSLKVTERVNLPAGTRCPPVELQDGMVTLCVDGSIECRSTDLKEMRWSYAGEGKILVEPVVNGEQLYCVFSNGKVVGLDIEDGTPCWTYSSHSESISGITIKDGMLVACSKDGWIRGIDIASGKELWTTEVKSFIRHAPVVSNNRIVVAANKNLICIDPSDGSIASEVSLGSEITTLPVVFDEYICLGTNKGNIHYRRIDSDQDIWVYYAGDVITSPPLMTADVIYVADKRGGLNAIVR